MARTGRAMTRIFVSAQETRVVRSGRWTSSSPVATRVHAISISSRRVPRTWTACGKAPQPACAITSCCATERGRSGRIRRCTQRAWRRDSTSLRRRRWLPERRSRPCARRRLTSRRLPRGAWRLSGSTSWLSTTSTASAPSAVPQSSGALVGIDVGTSSAKGIAVDPDSGRVLASAELEYPVSSPHPGWMEQQPETWSAATEDVLALLRADAPEILGIGFSGQMHGLVCLDADGAVIRPAILWNDQRSAPQCAALEAGDGLARLVRLTGNRALPGFTAPKLLWMRENEPEAYARIRGICLPKDYVRDQLVGTHRMDVADASGTLLLDVGARRWSSELLSQLDIPRSWLPELAESPEAVGTLHGVPVAAGSGAQDAAAVGAGITEPGPLSVVLGTSGVVLAATDGYLSDREGRVHAFCHAAPDRWLVMGVMLSAAGSLAWYHDTLLRDVAFDTMLGEAEQVAPGSEGLTFLPCLAGA